jgi:hypothetical protein
MTVPKRKMSRSNTRHRRAQWKAATPTTDCPSPSYPDSSARASLLNHVLGNREGLRVAVIVNDMSEVNIDAALVRGGEAALPRTEERLVEMTNGCICCTLCDDPLEEVDRLAREGRVGYLLIESSGISEPMPVAATFAIARDGRHPRRDRPPGHHGHGRRRR